MTAAKGADGLHRCTWPGLDAPEYTRYHDTEWGVPVGDDHKLFEKLTLEGFQSGLSWLTILRKRDTFRKAFDNFDAEKIARYDGADIARLLADTGIIRNRLKIEATIGNARAFLALQEKQRLGPYLWQFVDGKPVVNRFKSHGDVPPQTELSTKLSKALKSQGFRFVGPTTLYAFLQSMGFVNDHLIGCHRHAACAALQKAWVAPR
jgi:DNA-3-methyladenine glycosylase I